MSAFSDVVGGIIQRAIVFCVQELIPDALALVPGPIGALARELASTDWAKALETRLAAQAGALTGEALAKIEGECAAWVQKELAAHPAAAAFWSAIEPQTLPAFPLRADEMWALLADIKAGTLRGKLGLPPVPA